jgi:hypothetical protein
MQDVCFFCTVTLTKLSPGQRWLFSSCIVGTDALPRYVHLIVFSALYLILHFIIKFYYPFHIYLV